jgi:hypothetical protein
MLIPPRLKKFYPLYRQKDKRILIESGMRLWAIGDGMMKDRWTRKAAVSGSHKPIGKMSSS